MIIKLGAVAEWALIIVWTFHRLREKLQKGKRWIIKIISNTVFRHSFPLPMDNCCFSSRSSRSHQVCPGLRQLLPHFLLSSSLHKLTLLQVSPFPLLQVKSFQSKIKVYFSRYSTLVEMQPFPLSQPVVP